MAWLNDHCGYAGGINRNAEEGGMYKFVGDISSIVSSIEDGPEEAGYLVKTYPNPASRKAVVEFSLPFGGHVVLKLYDLNGKEIRTISSGNYPKGAKGTDTGSRTCQRNLHGFASDQRNHDVLEDCHQPTPSMIYCELNPPNVSSTNRHWF